MNIVDILAKEYPGDSAWKKFHACYKDAQIPRNSQVLLDDEITDVLSSKLGSYEAAKMWISKKLPALDGKTAMDVFSSNDFGHEIIRALLMRMP